MGVAVKRSPLKRSTPMKRAPMKRRPKSTSYSRRPRDFDRMGWIKTLRCACAVVWSDRRHTPSWLGGAPGPCSGPVEAHHAGVHGLGQKPADDSCIPLCRHHHRILTDRRECFANWYPGTLKTWELAIVAICQELWRSLSANSQASLH